MNPFCAALASAAEELRKIGFGFLDAFAVHQQHHERLQRLRRCGVGLVPDAGRFERQLGHAREVRDLDRASRHARIARSLGQVDERLGCEARAAPLRGDLAEQEVVQHRFGQVLRRQIGGRLVRGRSGHGIVVIVVVGIRRLLGMGDAEDNSCGEKCGGEGTPAGGNRGASGRQCRYI